MMFRSLRVSLVFWFAVILLASIVVLGVVLHRELRATLYREADTQLTHWITAVQAAGADEQAARDALPEGALFAVLGPKGTALASSIDLPATPLPTSEQTTTRDHHRWRTVARTNSAGWDAGWIVVGRSVRDENHSIRQFLTTLLVSGAGIVVLTCVGGFILATRVLAPARTIAATAQRIAADNLHERIDVSRVPSELQPMATTLNESFARIESAFSAQAAFTADASHELRTPLAVIVAHLDLARCNATDSDDVRERLTICQQAAQRIETIVKGLLHLARADAGETSLHRSAIDLGQLVDEHVRAMMPLASARDVALTSDSHNAVVDGDREQLNEVISNLVDNAIRYNRPNGTVTVSVVCEQEHALLRVTDTGIGLADEQLAKVFDRFYRADASRSRQDGASGLGLSITQSIVEQHGGSITAHSQGGEGCEFVVRLSLASTPATSQRSS